MKFAFRIKLSTYKRLIKNGHTFEKIRKLDFRASFDGASFDGASFDCASFYRASFDGASFDGASFYRASFNRASFYGASFNRASFNRASFDDASFNRASFNRASFDRASFDGASFYRASFYRASFNRASFNRASLNISGIGIQLKIGRYRASLVGKYISVGCVTRRIKDAIKGSEADYEVAHDEAVQYRYAVQRAIKAAFAMKRAARMNKAFKDVRFASEELEARLSALSKPAEKEYRAGEWVSALRESYFVIDGVGDIGQVINCNDDEDKEYQARGNAFPTKAIAKSAKAHADWWREFDLIADEQRTPYITYTAPEIGLSEPNIERLGGEQKVIEMLTKGRVFRFKWGGQ